MSEREEYNEVLNALDNATARHTDARQAEAQARHETTATLNALNSAQVDFDKWVEARRGKSANKGSSWGECVPVSPTET